MCGIYGALTLRHGQPLATGVLERMGEVTRHRGPDDQGRYQSQAVQMGMRRLSIIDLAGGHQPLTNEDETLWLVCNGEIYNFRKVREELKARGHRFRTGSDCEVILHLYEEHGDDFARHIDGMFAFALWDTRRRRLLLGRDRLGIKPLYYHEQAGRLVFASEAKAILAVPGVTAAIDPDALCEYLTLGYTPAPVSMLRGVRKLPPASLLICEDDRHEVRSYWRLPEEVDEQATEDEWADAILECLETAVTSQMVSDVPLGAFLSGGIDSSTVVALMARNSDQPVQTYSIGFDDTSGGTYYNELPWARQVAELFHTEHHEILVRPDVAVLLPRLLWHLDEPVADAAFITTYLVAEFARRDVTVILSGVGGDELFGGYRRYLGEHYAQLYGHVPAWLRRHLITPLARRLPSDRHSPLLNLSRYARGFLLSGDLPAEQRYRSYVQVFSPEQREELTCCAHSSGPDALDRAFSNACSGDMLRRLLDVDTATQLPDDLLMLTDRMTMAVSLECRVPLLDHELVEMSARMPSRYKIQGRSLKHILKRALGGLLPPEILYRKKRGFGAPMGAWLKRELAPLLRTVLSRESVEHRGLFDWGKVDETIRLHEANKEDHTEHLLALMNLELWSRIYLDGSAPEDLTAQIASGAAN